MAVVGVHSMGVWRRTLVCSSVGQEIFGFPSGVSAFIIMWPLWIRGKKCEYSRWVLHHPAPLDLHPLQHLMLMEPLHRGPERWYVVLQGLVVGWQVLRQWGTWTGEVVGRQGSSRGHSMARGVWWQWWMKGDSVGNDIIALWRGLSCKLGVPMRMRTGRGGLMMHRAC